MLETLRLIVSAFGKLANRFFTGDSAQFTRASSTQDSHMTNWLGTRKSIKPRKSKQKASWFLNVSYDARCNELLIHQMHRRSVSLLFISLLLSGKRQTKAMVRKVKINIYS